MSPSPKHPKNWYEKKIVQKKNLLKNVVQKNSSENSRQKKRIKKTWYDNIFDLYKSQMIIKLEYSVNLIFLNVFWTRPKSVSECKSNLHKFILNQTKIR